MYVQSSRNPVQKVLLLWLTHPTHVYDDVCNACRDTNFWATASSSVWFLAFAFLRESSVLGKRIMGQFRYN